MIKRYFISFILFLSVLFSSASCSVFDERGECPSYLTVWYDLYPGSVFSCGRNLDLLVSDGSGVVFDSPVDADDYPDGTDVKIVKGEALVSAWTGVLSLERSGNILSIPAGGECDSLYLHVGHPDCCDDLAEDHVVMHKQFCTLTVIVEGAEVWEGQGLWQALSQWCGLDVTDASSVAGDLATALRYIGGGAWQCRLVREGDYSLVLRFDGPTGEPLVIDLGRIMNEAGYDWGALDLDDFTLYIRKAEGTWSWSVAPWRDGGEYHLFA